MRESASEERECEVRERERQEEFYTVQDCMSTLECEGLQLSGHHCILGNCTQACFCKQPDLTLLPLLDHTDTAAYRPGITGL